MTWSRPWGSRGSKVKAQRRHALRRAGERFGVTLTRHDLDALVRQIQRGRAVFVEKQSERVSVFRVTLPTGQSAAAVYDRARKTVVTFLPPTGGDQAPS